MSMRRHHHWVSVRAVSWRFFAQRYAYLFFIFFSVALLVLGQTKPVAVEVLRIRLLDSLAPVLDAVSRPMSFASEKYDDIKSYFNLKTEIEKLRAENFALKTRQNNATALEIENRDLRKLLNYKAEPAAISISARVIANTGGPFVRSLIVTAGSVDGVREGMAAMTGEGLIGRVIEVGNWSSRILLITDLNSRIPVIVAESGDHAILAGDNSSTPTLLYLPQDSILKPGSHILTSGHGGIFPPNVPIGILQEVSHGNYMVEPITNLGRVNQVRLIDFNLRGGIFNNLAKEAAQAEQQTEQ